ncbi:MAG: GNAT family N-acetyltransferase [Bacteroidia bacterium]|nr:GNAT family N-acetyltransferase [Bacteroidia bacterium]
MSFEFQPPLLADSLVMLRPLQVSDFEALYAAASDPLLWAQHPNPLRYQREVFEVYFQGAMASGGALLIQEAATGEVIGSSRYYDLDFPHQVAIGYTFVRRDCWGRGHNHAAKRLMLAHAFRWVEQVIFHIGAQNIRSQVSIQRLGAILTGQESVSYYGEPPVLNHVYTIRRADWPVS